MHCKSKPFKVYGNFITCTLERPSAPWLCTSLSVVVNKTQHKHRSKCQTKDDNFFRLRTWTGNSKLSNSLGEKDGNLQIYILCHSWWHYSTIITFLWYCQFICLRLQLELQDVFTDITTPPDSDDEDEDNNAEVYTYCFILIFIYLFLCNTMYASPIILLAEAITHRGWPTVAGKLVGLFAWALTPNSLCLSVRVSRLRA